MQTESILYNDFIKKDGKKILKAKLLFVDERPKICDFCDNDGMCATLQSISTDNIRGDIIVVCKKCLEDIIKEFD